MNPLSNSRHEAFAQARFNGMPVMEAYHAAGYVGVLPQVASKVSQHPDVKARLMELHNAAAKVMAYERLDAIKDLVAIIKARPSEAKPDHPLCEVRTGRSGQYHRFPSKLGAMARLVKIMGWDEPIKVAVEEEQKPDRLTEWNLEYPQEQRHRIQRCAGQRTLRTIMRTNSTRPLQTPPRMAGTQSSAPPTALPRPLTPRQEAFARARFSGMGVMEAYRAAGYLGKSADRASRVNCHPPVAARLAQLRQAAEDALPYKRYEAINDLIAIVHASPEEASENNPLCEMRMGHDEPFTDSPANWRP